MANAHNLLQTAKKQKENGGLKQNTSSIKSSSQMMENVMASSSDLDQLENLYFNPDEQKVNPLTEAYEVYPNGQKRKVYDPEEDMKELSNFNIQNVKSDMPQAILESILNNPLNMPTEGIVYNGNDVDNMMDCLQNRSIDILKKLDDRDKQSKPGRPQYQQPTTDMSQMINETVQLQQSPVDYNVLAKLIESIIDKKFTQYSKTLLNEGRGQNSTTLSFMKLGDTFTFMDSANNVYECQMVYKGKGRIKKN